MPASRRPTPSSLQQRTDDWFRRASASLLGQLPCRAGCSQCCIGPFPITVLDAVAIQEGLKQLPICERADIEQRAAEQTARMEIASPSLKQSRFLDQWTDADIDRLIEEFSGMPCPALGENGLCRLYAHRPLACRSMGLPVENGSLTEGACTVQSFVPVVRLSASIRTEEQTLAHKEAVALEAYRRTTGIEGEEVLLPYGFLPALAFLHETADDPVDSA